MGLCLIMRWLSGTLRFGGGVYLRLRNGAVSNNKEICLASSLQDKRMSGCVFGQVQRRCTWPLNKIVNLREQL